MLHEGFGWEFGSKNSAVLPLFFGSQGITYKLSTKVGVKSPDKSNQYFVYHPLAL